MTISNPKKTRILLTVLTHNYSTVPNANYLNLLQERYMNLVKDIKYKLSLFDLKSDLEKKKHFLEQASLLMENLEENINNIENEFNISNSKIKYAFKKKVFFYCDYV